ncbi:MAG: TMEM175 family protein [Vulcanimicrobiaceae bacterium]
MTDGVFAVGLTLLILDVKPPEVPVGQLAGALLSTLPRLGIFALSFTIVGYYWVVDHLIFGYIRAADRGLLWMTLLFLFTIVVLPFSTAVLGRYPLAAPALVLYGANLAACSFSLGLTWLYALRKQLTAPLELPQRRYIGLRFVLAPSLALIAVAFASFVPLVSLVLYVALPLMYALTSGERRSPSR